VLDQRAARGGKSQGEQRLRVFGKDRYSRWHGCGHSFSPSSSPHSGYCGGDGPTFSRMIGEGSDVLLLVMQLGGFCKQRMVMVCWRPMGLRQIQIGPWAAQRWQGLDVEAIVIMSKIYYTVA